MGKAKCNSCGEVIVSKRPGHFVSCKCGKSFIDTDRWFPERYRLGGEAEPIKSLGGSMSGGHFDYRQCAIGDIADSIGELIKTNHDKDEYGYSYDFSDTTIQEFKNARNLLRKAAIYAQRIDWLVSGDDSEDTFHERLKDELEQL